MNKMKKITEKDIMFESDCDKFWVLNNGWAYSVMINDITHSKSDSHYSWCENGLSIAIARCKYLAKREREKSNEN